MTMAEDLIQLKTDVNDIFASKNIGASQTKGINDTFDAIITTSKAQEKPPTRIAAPPGINIQMNKK